MKESIKMPVSVYLIDQSTYSEMGFTDITERIISKINSRGALYLEEPVIQYFPGQFQIRVYSCNSDYTPKWARFLNPILDSSARIYQCKNFVNSVITFIEHEKNIFAITGGAGAFAIESFVSQTFGLDILVRLFEKDSKVIRSIQDRGVTGIIMGQTKFYRGDQRFSDENQFGKIFKQVRAELNEKILSKVFGFTKNDLKRKTSGCMAKSSFQINKSIDFKTLLSLIDRFTEILKAKEKFSINKVVNISKRNPNNHKLLQELEAQLAEHLFACYEKESEFDIDFTHREYEKFMAATNYFISINGKDDIELDSRPSLPDIIRELKRNKLFDVSDAIEFKYNLLNRWLVSSSDDNMLTQGSILSHIHCELSYKDNIYFLVDEEWYRINSDFVDDLNKECNDMLTQIWDDILIEEKFDLTKRESHFNQTFLGKPGWLVFDTLVPDNIEACDLLHFDDQQIHLIHVKKGFNNSIRDLASQVSIAAKRIKQDIKSGHTFLSDLELTAKRAQSSNSASRSQLGKQTFPPGGLKKIFEGKKDRQIIFCLAFVDTTKRGRNLRKDLHEYQSNIAKYSLIELHKEINMLGFQFKVIQLKNTNETRKRTTA